MSSILEDSLHSQKVNESIEIFYKNIPYTLKSSYIIRYSEQMINKYSKSGANNSLLSEQEAFIHETKQ